jgi:hypothetical protein
LSVRWRFNRLFNKKWPFDAILIFGRHFGCCPYNIFFFKVWFFLRTKTLEESKNILSLIFGNFSKIRLLKSAILIYAIILNYLKKKSFWKILIFEFFWAKTSFHILLKYLRHLGFFFQKFQLIRAHSTKTIRIGISI